MEQRPMSRYAGRKNLGGTLVASDPWFSDPFSHYFFFCCPSLNIACPEGMKMFVIPGIEFLPPKWGSYSPLGFSLYALKKHISQESREGLMILQSWLKKDSSYFQTSSKL